MSFRLLLAVATVCLCTLPVGAQPRCITFSGTADSILKPRAVQGSLDSLREAIDKWKVENGVTGPATETAEKPKPHPYWRSTISPDLFLAPDIVSDTAYTVCWKGVVSPVVCTSGTKLCW